MLALLTEFVTDEIARYGLLAIFVLMLLESAYPDPLRGHDAVRRRAYDGLVSAPEQQLDFWLVVLAGTVGNVVGSQARLLGRLLGGRPLVDRWGRHLLIRLHEVDRAQRVFERRGQSAVFVGRLLPVIRTFISLPAGVVRMGFWRFTFYTVLGCLPWCLAPTWVGALLGERWSRRTPDVAVRLDDRRGACGRNRVVGLAPDPDDPGRGGHVRRARGKDGPERVTTTEGSEECAAVSRAWSITQDSPSASSRTRVNLTRVGVHHASATGCGRRPTATTPGSLPRAPAP